MIKKSLLKPGDILLYRVTKKSWFGDRIIGWGQRLMGQNAHRDQYCHVSIIDFDPSTILEAKWPKTRARPLDLRELAKDHTLEHYRVKGTSKTDVKEALDWAHAHLGEWYDIPLFCFGFFSWKHAEVCSTYVAKAWLAAGIMLYKGRSRLITPDQVATSKHLKRIQ